MKMTFKAGDRVRFVGRPESCDVPPDPTKIYTVNAVPVHFNGVFLKGHSEHTWYEAELFKLAEPDSHVVPGVPEGYRLVRIGPPKMGELFLTWDGNVVEALCDYRGSNHVVLEKTTKTERLWVRVNNSTGDTVESWYLDGQTPPECSNISVVRTKKTREVPA